MRFFFAWFAQTIWVAVVGLPAYVVLAQNPGSLPVLGVFDYAGLVLWIIGFTFGTLTLSYKYILIHSLVTFS
jgi:steroid 5-alpha reductase family enzyme